MSDTINLVEKFLQYKDLILSSRFKWLSIFVLLSYTAYYLEQNNPMTFFMIISTILFCNSVLLYPWEKSYLQKITASMNTYDRDLTKRLLDEQKYLWLSYAAKIKFELLKIQFNLSFRGSTSDIFQSLKKLENMKLLQINGEYQKVILLKANVYRQVENIKMLEETLSKLASKDLQSNELPKYKFCESFLYEFNGNIEKAKDILLSLLEYKNIDKADLFNNIARLEEMQNNDVQAIHYYEKAYEVLLTNKDAGLFHIILHNLIVFNAKQNKNDIAFEWLKKYEILVDKKVLDQYSEFLNTQIVLARQLEDRILLLDGYSKLSSYVEPHLNRDDWLANFISKLRMSFNDNVNFDENMISAKNLFNELKELEFPKNYFAIKEIFHILKQLDEMGKLGLMRNFYFEVIDSIFSFENEIKQYRKNIPELAVSEQFFWMQEENFAYKIKLLREPSEIYFEDFFKEIKQLASYAKTYKNQYLEMKSYMMIVDEYIAYAQGLDGNFKNDFHTVANESLINCESLMQKNLDNIRFIEYLIPLGYYYSVMDSSQLKASEYLKLFQSKKINIIQYAHWQRFHYDKLLEAVNTKN